MKLEKENIVFENSILPWLGKTVKTTDYFLQEALKKITQPRWAKSKLYKIA